MKLLSLGRDLIEKGAWFFAPLSWIWAAAAFFKNIAYDRKWVAQARVPCTVVSVGNIVAGGTGKTPFVQMIASAFPTRRIAILTRGYGPIPDEAMLHMHRLPHAKIYVGKDRSTLAALAVQEGAELILLDDGFQHRKLHRDFDIVLLRGDDPFGKGHYLPWGFLRDSPKRLKAVDAVFIQGQDFCHAPTRILDDKGQEVPSIQSWKIGLFSGVGNPDSFRKTADSLGARIVAELRLADHEAPTPARLERFATRCKALGAQALVTTEKDKVKNPSCSLPIFSIEIAIEWLQGREQWEQLLERISHSVTTK